MVLRFARSKPVKAFKNSHRCGVRLCNISFLKSKSKSKHNFIFFAPRRIDDAKKLKLFFTDVLDMLYRPRRNVDDITRSNFFGFVFLGFVLYVNDALAF